MIFIKENLNPMGKRACDCVIRAVVKASNQTWTKVYDDLCLLGRAEFLMPNEKKTYEAYLKQIGFIKRPMPRFPDNTRYTIAEFAKANPKGVFIISVAKHLTCIVDGVLYDTWNCSYKSVGNYFTK